MNIPLKSLITFLFITLSMPLYASDDSAYWTAEQDRYESCVVKALSDSSTGSIDVTTVYGKCINPIPAPDLLIEGLTIAFPKTMTSFVYGDDSIGLASIIHKSFVVGAGKQIEKMTNVNPWGAYTSDSNPFYTKTLLYRYNSGMESAEMWVLSLEDVLSSFFKVISYVVSILLSFVFLRRIIKVGYDGKGGKVILMNSLKQSPVIAFSLLLVMPVDGHLPLLAQLLVCASFIGALIGNAFTLAIAPVLMKSSTNIDFGVEDDLRNNELFIASVNGEYTKFLEQASDGIIAMDLALSSSISNRIGDTPASNSQAQAEFTKNGFKSDCFMRDSWHVLAPARGTECLSFTRNSNTFEFKGGYRDLIKGAPDENPNLTELLSAYNSNERKAHSDKNRLLFNNATTRKLIDSVYALVDKKKDALCSSSSELNKWVTFQNEWFCTEYNHKRARWNEGHYYAQDYANHLRDRSIQFTGDDKGALVDGYFDSGIDESVIDDIISGAADFSAPNKAAMTELIGSIDVRQFVFKGVLSSIWAGISFSSQILKQQEEINEKLNSFPYQYFSEASMLFPHSQVNDLGVMLFNDDHNKIAEKISELNSMRGKAAGSEVKTFDNLWNSVFLYVTNIDAIACSQDLANCGSKSGNQLAHFGSIGTIFLGTGMSIKATTTAVDALSFIFAPSFNEDASDSSSAKKILSMTTAFLDTIGSALMTVALLIIAFTVLPFFMFYLYGCLKIFIRLLVYLVASPIVLIKFLLLDNNEDESSENDVWIPADLLGMGLRLVVDSIALSVSVILSLIITYINLAIFSIFVSTALVQTASNITSFVDLVDITLFLLVVVLSVVSLVFAFYKGAALQPYINEKLTEFAYTGFNLETDKDDEAKEILYMMLPLVGIFKRKTH